MAAPTITSLTPSTGPATGGTSIAVVGVGFTGTTGVTIGGTAATSFTVNSDVSLTVVAEAHAAGAVDLIVTNGTGPSSTGPSDLFTYVAAPVVSSVTPATGEDAGDISVTIVGTGFTGASAVHFGATSATFTVTDSTHIAATAPNHIAGVVDVTVTTVGGTSATGSGDHFTYTAPAEGTYTQIDGTEDVTYFMDVEISPATVADGSLLTRLDPIVYPEVGKVDPPKQGTATIPPSRPPLGPDF